jgi:hypothetical protein
LLSVVVARVVEHQLQTLACKELMVELRASLVVVQRLLQAAVAVVVHTVLAVQTKVVEMALQLPTATAAHPVQVVVHQ